MNFKRAILGLTLLTVVMGCQPYISTNLTTRHHVRVDRYWLGYTKKGPLHSNKLLAVTAVRETSALDKDGKPAYNVYVATTKGIQVYSEETEGWNDVNWGQNSEANPGTPITGVFTIYDDKPRSRIFISSSSGLYYKRYGEAAVYKINSPTLKAVNLLDPTFKDPESSTRITTNDVDGYDIEVAEHAGQTIIFLGTATGLYFCTKLNTDTETDANNSTWGNIVGGTIVTMQDKQQDYPLSQIPGALKKYDDISKQMQVFYQGKFYIGDEAWAINEVNYDPIYDPVFNPIYNKEPDFYTWEGTDAYIVDGNPVTLPSPGYPISFKTFIDTKGTYTEDKTWDNLSDTDKIEQYKARYAYESQVEINDRANPNNTTTGVVRAYAYYRDFFLKSNRITGVSVYDGKIHLAAQNCGVSYADIPDNIDSGDPATYKYMIWETYTNNYFHYPSIQQPVTDRAEENFWSLSDVRGLCINVNSYGIFYGAMDGGIHQAPTYKQIRTVRDVFGLAVDNKGNPQCILTPKGEFQYFNQFYFPELAAANPTFTKEAIADLYFRADRDANDGIANDNLQEGLRLNWQEYTTRGWSIYVAQGSTVPYQSPVYKFPNNTIKKIRFGNLDKVELIYIATANGLGVAVMRKSYSTHDYQKYPATVTGTEQYSVDFADWGRYHKDMTRLVEENYMQDVSVTKDEEGNDRHIYCATDGQGLVRFYWKAYDQKPHNLKINDILAQ